MSIGLRIKQLREENKLSQKDFATKIGISRSNLGQIETGNQLPTLKILSEIVRIYHTSYDYLIDGIRIITDEVIAYSSEKEPTALINKIVELTADKTRLEIELESLKKRIDPTMQPYNVAAEKKMKYEKSTK